jgi:hypothetical protein
MDALAKMVGRSIKFLAPEYIVLRVKILDGSVGQKRVPISHEHKDLTNRGLHRVKKGCRCLRARARAEYKGQSHR